MDKNCNSMWIRATKYSQSYCSNCRLTPKTIFGMLPPFCPNCGAKMINVDWVENNNGILLEHIENYLQSMEDNANELT